MFKIEFDAANLPLAAAIGAALTAYGNGEAVTQLAVTTNTTVEKTTTHAVADVSVTETEKVALTVVEEAVKTEKPAETVTEQDTSTATQNSGNVGASASPSSGAPDGNATDNLDEKGVGFNPAFCSKAAVPFNQTGKKKGQWKRRQGVAEAAYDAWHAASLAAVVPGAVTSAETTTEDVNTAAAFTPAGQNTAPVTGGLTFTDAGAFMSWLSEQQAANLLTSIDIDGAYPATQSEMADLFNPATSKVTVEKLYAYLAPISAGQA